MESRGLFGPRVARLASGAWGTRAVTGVAGCGDIRETLGVYVLGAIGPAGRAAVDSHLAGCAVCREELAGLAGLPGRLAGVPVSDVTRMTWTLRRARPAGGRPEGRSGRCSCALPRSAGTSYGVAWRLRRHWRLRR